MTSYKNKFYISYISLTDACISRHIMACVVSSIRSLEGPMPALR